MGQHPTPDPDPYEDEDLEELGAPVYEGSGLSVRALTAEELQRFLDAHHGQPTQPLGSGLGRPGPGRAPRWGSLGRTGSCAGASRTRAVGTGQGGRRQPWPLGPGAVSAAPQPGAGRLGPQPGQRRLPRPA
jgi:hypothetical protein